MAVLKFDFELSPWEGLDNCPGQLDNLLIISHKYNWIDYSSLRWGLQHFFRDSEIWQNERLVGAFKVVIV